MTPYITQASRQDIIDLPLCLPQTALAPYEILPIATVDLKLGQRLRFRWANLQLVNIPDEVNGINRSMGYCCLAMYANIDNIHKPTGQPLVYLSSSELKKVKSLNPYTYRDFTVPARYEFLVINNDTGSPDRTSSVVVTGTLRLYLNG
jgi:hypothetical protein